MTWAMPSEPVKAQAEEALSACGRGELAPNVALMRLIMACDSASEVEMSLCAASQAADDAADQRLSAALALWRQTPGVFATVKAVLGSAEAGGETVADWKRVFDEAATLSPEVGVALYSLGRPDLLEAATAEIVQSLKDRNVLAPGAWVLEIGCGTGRLLPALARCAEVVVGLDISPAMLSHAASSGPGASAMLVQGSGLDLAPFTDHAFDLALAVDSFPYIVAAGEETAATHMAEAARVLKPGGHLVIINYSYRGDDALDRRDIADSARQSGLLFVCDGRREFALWDGLVFHLHKPA